jgi:tRNA-dihydrouridine synthase
MANLWHTLPTPFFALAPMADVTDPAFRRIIAHRGKPDVFWTEFVSADGLFHTREIQKMPDAENPLMRALIFSEEEHPIVAQIFSANPDMVAYAVRLVRDLGFDGVDINMGCPDASVEKQGAGASLMKNHGQARVLLETMRAHAGDSLGVSVKTRLGYRTDELGNAEEGWLATLLSGEPDLITLHARTRKEMSKVPARWERVGEAVHVRDRFCENHKKEHKTRIMGNGDLVSVADAREKVAETGADGAMLGRAVFGNPWLFSGRTPESISLGERLETLAEHCSLYEELLPHKSFSVMKKHFGSYVAGWRGAKELRERLHACASAYEVREVVRSLRGVEK